jgi:predicted TIM-barrel fold metal-dependent hydrolase
MSIINIHTHIFTNKNVPDKFLPFFMVRILVKYKLTRKLARFLHNLNPLNSNDTFDKYANFIKDNDSKTFEEIFLKLKNYYPQNSSFAVLSMDFEFMEAGYCKQGFLSQLNDLYFLRKKYGNEIYPFIAADPRRENLLDIVIDFIENKEGKGIKIYPPLGYYPFDQRLYPVFDYAQKNKIPVVTHCNRGGIYYRGKLTDKDLIHPKTGERFSIEKNKYFSRNWSNPKNYEYILKDFPDLYLNFAHFGGEEDWSDYLNENHIYEDSWIDYILNLIEKYPNVYSDIAYTLTNVKNIQILKTFLQDTRYKEKILFGSDFYMNEIEVFEDHFSTNLRKELGEEFFLQIAVKNNKKFLNI